MKISKSTLRLASLALLTVGFASAQAQDFVRGRVLVKFYDGATSTQKSQALQSVNARSSRPIGSGISLVELPSISVESSVVAALSRNPKVQFAELDHVVQAESEPNDPWFVQEWYLGRIAAPEAWAYSVGSASVVIAVLDSGIDTTHPDLATKIVPGWSTFDNTSNVTDMHGHGTRVSGVASSVTNNGLGVASLAWNCRLMPIRVSGSNGDATSSTIVAGLDWAGSHGARVANISYAVTDISAVRTAAQNFVNRGGVVVASAGNSGLNSSAQDNPYIITVSATDWYDNLYSWSNRGSNVDVAAPGDVYTTARGGGYSGGSGTSFSSPIVASLAALLFSVDPSRTPSQVMAVIEATCDDLGSPGWDNTFASGRVNARRAVEAVFGGGAGDSEAPSISLTSPANGATVSGSVTISANAADNVGVSSVSFWVDGVQIGLDSTAPYAIAWNTSGYSNGTHTIAAKAFDAAGNSTSASIAVEVANSAGDTNPPLVRITAPTQGTVVSNSQSIYAQAVDDVRVAKVELYVDGRLTATSTSAPFTTKWSTRKAARGVHTLKLRALDTSGNYSWSDPVDVVK